MTLADPEKLRTAREEAVHHLDPNVRSTKQTRRLAAHVIDAIEAIRSQAAEIASLRESFEECARDLAHTVNERDALKQQVEDQAAELAELRARLLERANEEPVTGWIRQGEDGYENTPQGARDARDAALAKLAAAEAERDAAKAILDSYKRTLIDTDASARRIADAEAALGQMTTNWECRECKGRGCGACRDTGMRLEGPAGDYFIKYYPEQDPTP